ncbi:hypothetical protein D9M71_462320 [compost metagenome]
MKITHAVINGPFAKHRGQFLQQSLYLPKNVARGYVNAHRHRPLKYVRHDPFRCVRFQDVQQVQLNS